MSNFDYIKIVPDQERTEFLPTHFPKIFNLIENSIYVIAERMIDGYESGYWEYAHTENNLPIAFPSGQDTLSICSIDGAIPTPVVGLVITAQAILLTLAREESLDESETPFGKITEEEYDNFLDLYHQLISAGYELSEKLNVGALYFDLVD